MRLIILMKNGLWELLSFALPVISGSFESGLPPHPTLTRAHTPHPPSTTLICLTPVLQHLNIILVCVHDCDTHDKSLLKWISQLCVHAVIISLVMKESMSRVPPESTSLSSFSCISSVKAMERTGRWTQTFLKKVCRCCYSRSIWPADECVMAKIINTLYIIHKCISVQTPWYSMYYYGTAYLKSSKSVVFLSCESHFMFKLHKSRLYIIDLCKARVIFFI